MKKAEIIYNQFLQTAKYLLKELDYYGENQFKQRIEGQQWTLGQFYDYLLNGTVNFYIPEIQKCIQSSSGNVDGKKTAKGKFLFWYGRYPAVFKHNEISGYTPVQPESPEKVKDSFYRFIKIMARTAQEIDKANSLSKTLHPEFGMLTASEWYKLIEINFKHQLKVKYELDRVVRNVSFEDDDLPDMEAVREARARGMQEVKDSEELD